MGKNLVGTVNAGFKITKQGKEAVIGHRESDNMYVAWHYDINEGKANYYWGRYGNKEYAEECYYKKENGIYSGD